MFPSIIASIFLLTLMHPELFPGHRYLPMVSRPRSMLTKTLYDQEVTLEYCGRQAAWIDPLARAPIWFRRWQISNPPCIPPTTYRPRRQGLIQTKTHGCVHDKERCTTRVSLGQAKWKQFPTMSRMLNTRTIPQRSAPHMMKTWSPEKGSPLWRNWLQLNVNHGRRVAEQHSTKVALQRAKQHSISLL